MYSLKQKIRLQLYFIRNQLHVYLMSFNRWKQSVSVAAFTTGYSYWYGYGYNTGMGITDSVR